MLLYLHKRTQKQCSSQIVCAACGGIGENVNGHKRREAVDMKKCRFFLLVFLIYLSGCSQNEGELIVVRHTAYEKRAYETTEVRKGELTPTVSFTLSMTATEHIQYQVTDAELEIQKVAVSVGDRVKKGDLLLAFQSEELQGRLAEYQKTDRQNRLLIRHYKKLQKLEKSKSADLETDYGKQIRDLQREQEVTQLYIRETKEKIRRNQIYAKRDGIITRIDPKLRQGTYQPGQSLMTETCGSGEYKAETEKSVKLPKGTLIQAADGSHTYQFRVTKEKREKNGKKLYFFRPVSDMGDVGEETVLTARWKKKTVADCIYVKKTAVCRDGGKYYVRRMDEKGYFETAEVSVGQEVGEYIVITGGLSEGEKVRAV